MSHIIRGFAPTASKSKARALYRRWLIRVGEEVEERKFVGTVGDQEVQLVLVRIREMAD